MLASLRKQVIVNKCYWCGYTSTNSREFDADHLIPRSLGGATTLANLVCACFPCNRSRQAKPINQSQEWISRSKYLRMSTTQRNDMALTAMLKVQAMRKGN